MYQYDDQTQWATVPRNVPAVGPGRDDIGDAGELAAKLVNAQPGTTYVITANIDGGGRRITVGANGTKANPIIIRSVGTSRSTFKELSNLELRITGAHVYVCYLAIDGSEGAVSLGGTRNSVEFCWLYGAVGHAGSVVEIASRAAGRHLRVRFCDMRPRRQPGRPGVIGGSVVTMEGLGDQPNHPQHVYVYRNIVTGAAGSSGTSQPHPLYFGRGEADDAKDVQLHIYDNLFVDNRTSDLIEVKTVATINGNTFDFGTINGARCTGVRVRHGMRRLAGSAGIVGCEIEGNLFVKRIGSSPGGAGDITVKTGHHKIRNNWAVELNAAGQPTTGSPTHTQAVIGLFAGNIDIDRYPESNDSDQPAGSRFPNSGYCEVGGNRMRVVVGYKNATYNPHLGSVFNQVGADTGSRADRNLAVQNLRSSDYVGRGVAKAGFIAPAGTPRYGAPLAGVLTTVTPPPTAIAGADYDLPPHRWLEADCGCEATNRNV